MIDHFIRTVNSLTPLSPLFIQKFQEIISVQRLPGGTLLLGEGQVSDKIFFLCKGLTRSFYFEKDQEVTSRIAAENDFIYPCFSFIEQKKSMETIQLLENSTVISIRKQDLDALYQQFPETAYLALKITECYLLIHDARIRSMRLSAEERLSDFKKRYPHLWQG